MKRLGISTLIFFEPLFFALIFFALIFSALLFFGLLFAPMSHAQSVSMAPNIGNAGNTNYTNKGAIQKIVVLLSETIDEEEQLNPIDSKTKDLLHYLEQQLNLEFEFRRYPWIRAMHHTARGEGLLLGMSKTPERQRKYVFSDPISYSANWLVTRCDQAFPYKELSDLKGKTIGLVKGTSSGKEFDRAINHLFKVEEDTATNFSRLNKLKMQHMDAQVWFDFEHDAKRLETRINRIYQRGSKTTKEAHLFCVLPKPVSILTNHIASDKKIHAALINNINQTIAKGRKLGVLPPIQ
jgi:polar amino acid transport system substrate-binding protein